MASPTAVQLEWIPPREEDVNGVVQAYVVTINLVNITDPQTGAVWQQRIEDDTDALIESLHPFYSYSFSVAAETVALGPFTPPITIEMPEDGKCLEVWHTMKKHFPLHSYSSIKSSNNTACEWNHYSWLLSLLEQST